MDDEGTHRAMDVSTAHENLRPIRAAEIDDLSLARLHGPSVLTPHGTAFSQLQASKTRKGNKTHAIPAHWNFNELRLPEWRSPSRDGDFMGLTISSAEVKA
jgi:hypothetical protein